MNRESRLGAAGTHRLQRDRLMVQPSVRAIGSEPALAAT
jgi:hypothetical protein